MLHIAILEDTFDNFIVLIVYLEDQKLTINMF